MTIEIDGKKMKQCPGWTGNKGRCGRGNPRLIPETAEVCENCSRGMRKAGQRTREEEEERERKKAAAAAKIAKAVEIFEGRLDASDPLPLDSEAGHKAAIRAALEAVGSMTNADLGETWSYYKDRPISAPEAMRILRAYVGLEPDDEE